jgi:hypothetical protein
MKQGAASNPIFQNGPGTNEPRAKVMGIDGATENSPRTEHRGL